MVLEPVSWWPPPDIPPLQGWGRGALLTQGFALGWYVPPLQG
ncbi:hypothetical protein ACFL59_13800 [Planctomycetota bacterium]